MSRSSCMEFRLDLYIKVNANYKTVFASSRKLTERNCYENKNVDYCHAHIYFGDCFRTD